MARANSVTGNYIGRNQAGTSSIPNGRGVWVGSEAQAGFTGVAGRQGRRSVPGEGNWISGNTTDGVFIIESESGGMYVQGNMIDSNGGPGVNLLILFDDLIWLRHRRLNLPKHVHRQNGRGHQLS